MYHFSYTVSPEEYKEVVRRQVYGEQKKKTLWGRGKSILGRVLLFLFLSVALAAAFGLVPAIVLVTLGFLVFNKNVLYHITYWRESRSKGQGASEPYAPVNVTFDEIGIVHECGGMALRQVYSGLLDVEEGGQFLRVEGKKGAFLIPKRAVGTEEEIRDFMKFVKDKIERGRRQIYSLKKAKEETMERCPYSFYFTRTVDDLINSQAEASPVSFFSKWFWTPSKVLLWMATVLFFVVVIFITWRTGKMIAWTVPLLLVLELLYTEIISRSNFQKRRKKLLKQRTQLMDNELVGHQLMSFDEEKLTIFTELGYVDKPWSNIGFLNDNGRDLRFVLRGGSCYLLPRKVFESEERLEEFKDYCGRRIAAAGK